MEEQPQWGKNCPPERPIQSLPVLQVPPPPGLSQLVPPFLPPDELKVLRVSIAKFPPVRAVLSGSLTIPCHITYLRPLPTAETVGRQGVRGTLRVKWTFLVDGKETEILVARGLKVKVSEIYRNRVFLPFYPDSPMDATLVLSELRSNDSGLYRCDAQHGIEDGQDFLEVKVKGKRFPPGSAPAHPGLSPRLSLALFLMRAQNAG